MSLNSLVCVNDVRELMKKRVIEIQSGELLKRMVLSSKMDRVLVSGYKYDGTMMKYLSGLNFRQARAIFMSRYRMWPTKTNFPGRWRGTECNCCGHKDTDEHILVCPGYSDIVDGSFALEVFWDEVVLNDMERLKYIADTVVRLIERMEQVQGID